ncbi:hypothetical protein DMC18_01245 [Caulobacter sp. D5]|uniref:AMP-binding protein n=1 Tax=Caulobacter sp. D5 TaxID=357400 RepID=UPI000D73A613|nr:AMP-binding protein [Caulobacter sp. D5]PXA96508.1 hypothetical protein DMC18_01245 [Caulobacter sp. D5]
MNIFAPLLDRAERAPGGLFCRFVSKGRTTDITNADIVRRASGYAAALRDRGVKPGDIVFIVLEHSPDLYASFIGCVIAGAAPSFMSPLTPKQDPAIFRAGFATLLEREKPRLTIVSSTTAAVLPDDQPHLDSGEVEPCDTVGRLRSDGDEVAFLQHSSGTVGHKKGVMLTHAQVHRNARDYAHVIGLDARSTVVSWLPLYHDMGLITSFMAPAIVGCPIVSIDPMEWVSRPAMLLEWLSCSERSYAWLPNFALQHILRTDRKRDWDLSSVEAIISCSEPCRTGAVDAFTARYADMGLKPAALGASYAMAETVFAITQTEMDEPPRPGRLPATRGFVSSGKPLPGVIVDIRNDRGEALDNGEMGEIWVRSPTLFAGYYLQPELTRSRLHEGWYRTGDVGVIETDGALFVIGRTDDLIITNGKNLVAHEIEDLVSTLDGVVPGRVLAHGLFDAASSGTELVMLVESSVAESRQVELASTIRKTVYAACGVQPASVTLLPPGFIVKSSSGKLARKATWQKHQELGESVDAG